MAGHLAARRGEERSPREDELERQVRRLLNRVCPDSVAAIAEQLALVQLHRVEELDFVIGVLCRRALAEPYYSETYADLALAMRTRWPEFVPENGGKRVNTFTRLLLNTCQDEFEHLFASLVGGPGGPAREDDAQAVPGDLRVETNQAGDQMLAYMRFMGSLFLRHFLTLRILGHVLGTLVGFRPEAGRLPEARMVECVCELLKVIGKALEATPAGRILACQVCAHLVDLRRSAGADGEPAFSKRTQFQIQELLQLRMTSWGKPAKAALAAQRPRAA